MNTEPIFRKLYIGIRPRLHLLTESAAGAVFMYLLSKLNDKTGQCDPKAETIAAALRIDRKTVFAAFHRIEESGAAKRVRRGRGNNWEFAALDIRVTAADTSHETVREVYRQTVRVEQPVPQNGTSDVPFNGTGGVPPNGTSDVPPNGSLRRNQEEELIEEEKRAYGPAVADAPAPLSAQAASKGRSGGKGRKAPKPVQPLTDQDLEQVQSSVTALAGYYLHGRQAVTLPRDQWLALPPSPTNWAPQSRVYERPEPGIPLPALAAYAAYRIICARIGRGESRRLLNLSTVIGVIKGLRAGRTEAQLIDHIDTVTKRWPEIQAALGNWGTGLALDERILAVPQVVAQAERLQTVSQSTLTPKEDTKYGHLYS